MRVNHEVEVHFQYKFIEAPTADDAAELGHSAGTSWATLPNAAEILAFFEEAQAEVVSRRYVKGDINLEAGQAAVIAAMRAAK